VGNCGKVTRYLFGWGTDDAVANLLQIVVAFGIVLALVRVNGTVDLDDDSGLRADEIDDIWADRILAAEAPPVELTPPEHSPQALLGRRRPSTLIASGFSQPDVMCFFDPIVTHTDRRFSQSILSILTDSPSPARGREGRGVRGVSSVPAA
jgi:hypothetical protein